MFDRGGLFASGFVLICGLWFMVVVQYSLVELLGLVQWCNIDVGQYLLAWFSSAILAELLGFGQCLV